MSRSVLFPDVASEIVELEESIFRHACQVEWALRTALLLRCCDDDVEGAAAEFAKADFHTARAFSDARSISKLLGARCA